MTILIKRFQLGAAGREADGQQVFDGDVLTLGASSDRDIIIEWPGVQLRHATARLTDKQQLRVESNTQTGLVVGEQQQHQATITPGQHFTIGNHEFGFTIEHGQAVLTVTINELLAKPVGAEPKTRLAHANVSKRRWSLGLLAFIGLAFLVLPLVNRGIQDMTGSDTVNYVLPSDSSWNTGSFHPAHQFFANDCSTCHNKAFTQVTNETCMGCHEAVALHYEAAILPSGEHQEIACQSCHKEHNGSTELVMDDKKLCVNCHQDIDDFTHGKSEQASVSDWESTHPEITLQMHHWDSVSQQWNASQQDASNPAAEKSGVLFPHDIHLDAAGFDIGEDQPKVLGCADCHQPEPGGALMAPVSMEEHCESCHRLDFDLARPELTVRHGDIHATLRDIAGLKGLDALLPELEAESKQTQARPPVVSKLKRPGKQAKSAAYIKQITTLAGLAEELIEKRGCATCHTVNKDHEAFKENRLLDAWTIDPVHLSERWIDDSEFDHSGHTSIDCATCHMEIENSESAEDVHIPSRDNCLQCHGNPGNDGLSESQCVDCHSYHLPHRGWEVMPHETKDDDGETE